MRGTGCGYPCMYNMAIAISNGHLHTFHIWKVLHLNLYFNGTRAFVVVACSFATFGGSYAPVLIAISVLSYGQGYERSGKVKR